MEISNTFFLELSYRGTAYHGWQEQENTAETVQRKIEDVLSQLLNSEIKITGCGRTDTGVHARKYFAHIITSKIELPLNKNKWVYKINSLLPDDIVVDSLYLMRKDAHARYSAVSRTYKYYITKNKNAFAQDLAWKLNMEIDIDKLNKAASALLLYDDFSSFKKAHTQNKSNKCKVTYAKWSIENDMIVFTITADRFLRNMVRAIVGTMIDIAKGKLNENDFCTLIENRSRTDSGMSAPAHGLFLVNVQYPKEIFIE